MRRNFDLRQSNTDIAIGPSAGCERIVLDMSEANTIAALIDPDFLFWDCSTSA
jgi:hypothetical protein